MLRTDLPKIITETVPGPKAKALIDRRKAATPTAIGCVYPVAIARGEGAMIKGEVKNDDAVRKELADVKAKLLVQEGITRELRDILLEKSKIDAKKKAGLEK